MSQIDWVFARSQLLDLLRRMTHQADSTVSPPAVRAGVGLSTADDRIELIGRASIGDPWIGLIPGGSQQAERIMRIPPAGCIGVLGIGRGAARGAAGGFCNFGDGIQPIDALRPVGAGMHRIMLGATAADAGAALEHDPARLEKWSRTIGALGLDGWRRLTRLHVAVMGSGSTATALKAALLRIGTQRITHANMSDPENRRGAGALGPLPLEAVKPCELILLAADDPAARAAACAIAVLYGKPLLEVTAFAGRSAAAVSLILPGQGHCLTCMNLPPTRSNPVGGTVEDAAAEDFAVGVALRMLEDLVVERIGNSLVAQISFDDHGRLSVQYPPVAGRAGCRVCAWAGAGDAGAGHFLDGERMD